MDNKIIFLCLCKSANCSEFDIFKPFYCQIVKVMLVTINCTCPRIPTGLSSFVSATIWLIVLKTDRFTQ